MRNAILRNPFKRELYATDCKSIKIKFYTADQLPCFGRQIIEKWSLNLGRMNQTAHQHDGFNALRLYCSKLDPACLCYDSKPAKLHKARWAIQLLNHLLGLPNRASSRYFQERWSTVTYTESSIFWIFLLISPNFRHFPQRFRRIQSWYRVHSHGAGLVAGDFHNFELWFDLCRAKFHLFVRYQMRVLIG